MSEPQEEIWIFGGNRVMNNKRFHAWLAVRELENRDPIMFFAAKGSFVVGTEYRVRVTRDGDRVTKHGTPERHGRHADDTLRAKLEAEHAVAERKLRIAAYEREDKRSSALQADLEPVLTTARALRGYDREIFALYVYNRIVSGR